MRTISLILIFGFLILGIVTFYFGIHKSGRKMYIRHLYYIGFLYSTIVGIYFLTHTPSQFLGHSILTCILIISLSIVALIILFYIGYTRISTNRPWLHLLYLASLSGLPYITYQRSIIITDSISTLASTICFWGLIRMCEKKRTLITYLLIATGISGCIMTRITSASACLIMTSIIFISMIIKEHSFKTVLKKEFIFTLPIYVLATVMAPPLTLIRTTEYFYNGNRPTLAIVVCAFELLWFTPVLFILPNIRKYADDLAIFIVAGWMSILLTFLYQLPDGFHVEYITWYFGIYLAMHFVPFDAIFALATIFVAQGLLTENGFDPETEITTIKDGMVKFVLRLIYNQLIYIVVLLFCFALFFGNFPFFLFQL